MYKIYIQKLSDHYLKLNSDYILILKFNHVSIHKF